MNNNPTTQETLIREVLEKDRCSACGACVGLCPYFTFFQGRVVALDRCSLSGGRCGQFCPHLRPNAALKEDGPGRVLERWMTRAQAPGLRKKGQYGGTVTALVLLALELDWVQEAVLTGTGKNGEPEGRVCRTRAEVLECAGSKYSGAGTLSALHPLLEAGGGRQGVVGTPCQITAVDNIRSYRSEQRLPVDTIALKIGLFCTWSLPYAQIRKILLEKGVTETILKYDVPPPPAEEFRIFTRKSRVAIPLAELRPLVPRGCLACGDMTAESADIAVGSAEGVPGWNTVLICTERGLELFREARSKNVLQVKPLPDENWEHLGTAVANKKKRARAQEERSID
ncbi:MAG: Coenzyme F420 hydrogenase/dehydrogenase, beta subunit C-terminal domain [Deltaproteobacteria bacterium]|nr:Coenzyme F420 hydrogenase/dehydrogenase, beta subunit C-terminal domain [Deltaproteobacteria bacterium]